MICWKRDETYTAAAAVVSFSYHTLGFYEFVDQSFTAPTLWRELNPE